MDILEMKLAAGVQIRDYVKTYGDRKNEAGTFAKCKSNDSGLWCGSKNLHLDLKAVFKQEFVSR
jgi:hypothetical protein